MIIFHFYFHFSPDYPSFYVYRILIDFVLLWRDNSLVNSTVLKSVIMVEESVPSSNFYKRRVDETLHQAKIIKICE